MIPPRPDRLALPTAAPVRRRRPRPAWLLATALLAQLAACAVLLRASRPTPATTPAPRAAAALSGCNGSPALCDRRYDEVVYPTTHNAMSSAEDWFIKPNQRYGIARQLADGVRALMLDTHRFLGEAYLCHASCLLGGRPLVDGLREVGAFLEANRGEVVTLLLESHVSAAETERAFARSGLLAYVHTQPRGAPWPTLRALIARNTRLVVFTETGGGAPAWYHPLWDFAWETPYAFRSPADFTCAPNRGAPGNGLFVLNHFLTNLFGDRAAAPRVNRDALWRRAERCYARSGRLPNFVAVDHYDLGALFDVVRRLNGLPAAVAARP